MLFIIRQPVSQFIFLIKKSARQVAFSHFIFSGIYLNVMGLEWKESERLVRWWVGWFVGEGKDSSW